ncbi:protein PET117 homolog, mitochondrial [Scyliorhinus torazame]|uniref:protein PET117 homolog, mitochondrial n=1 Tax=Scyliorhinus torazame TaxID=75743 RepID=UPI003B5C6FE0
MSTVSKVVLGISVVLTVGTVAGVHLKQQLEKERLREGVFRDLERQERKKENLQNLGEQIILTKKLEADRLQRSTLASGNSQQSAKQ